MKCFLFGFMIYIYFIDKGHQHKIIFSTNGKIKETDLITGKVADLLTNLQSVIHSIDYDYKYEYVYFTRFEQNDILRFRYPSEQPYISETVTMADKPVGVAVDPLSSHVYLTEYGTGKLYRCNLDGSNKINILKDDPLYALTLDLSHRLMYYSTYLTGDGKIKRARLNGTEKQTIIHSSHRIYGMSIDATENQLYWMEYTSSDLKSSNTNGDNEIKVVSTNAASTNIGIHVYGSNVYCATGTTILNVTITTTTIKNVIYSDPERIFSVIFYTEK
ncbi:low-density lipoprotein receptor-related protein 6-like [Mytilus californianus]|uniref:low-density lipoprotein receptor-related protein 6-like n=1 Tax=Mytilus californianus TaxID=6549 RepID=UPI0022479C79|nr:low-density lipoprotein receptor-related protein 6-like [Mytilus californianus]